MEGDGDNNAGCASVNLKATAALFGLHYLRVSPACFHTPSAIVMFSRRAKVAMRKQIAGNSDLAGSSERPRCRGGVAGIVRCEANSQYSSGVPRNNVSDGTVAKCHAAGIDPKRLA